MVLAIVSANYLRLRINVAMNPVLVELISTVLKAHTKKSRVRSAPFIIE
jgi:hypothetical protein